MPRVEVREDESLEKALRRFKRMLEREGILKALKAKKHYEKPSERKRREMRQAISRRARTMSEALSPSIQQWRSRLNAPKHVR